MVKVTVLGAAGGIGQPLSLLLRLNPKITELALYDIVNAKGISTDLSHIPNSTQTIKGYIPKDKQDTTELSKALNNSTIVIIPAGIPRKPGMTRDDLFKINASIVKGLVHHAGLSCPDAFICVISNPVNSTVPIAVEELKGLGVYNPKKVFGITTLDNLRLEQFLSEQLIKVTSRDLVGDVITIGGHSGETIVPILNSWVKNLSEEQYRTLIHRVQFGGDEVVKAKNGAGSATLSMATAAYRFTSNLLDALVDGTEVNEVAFIKLDKSFIGYSNIPRSLISKVDYFSLPIKLSNNGVASVSYPKSISKHEQKMIDIAIPKLQGNIAKGVKFVTGPKL